MNSKHGITLIEIIITIVWISICIIPMIYTYNQLIILQSKLFQKSQALTIAQSNIEIISNISQGNWQLINSFPQNTPLTLTQNLSTNFWEVIEGTTQSSIYETYFLIEPICRDNHFTIVDCQNQNVTLLDSNSLKITSITEWRVGNSDQTIELSTNISKIL